MRTVHDFLKKVGTYYIATAEGGQPRVRPFGTINLFEGKLYIQSGLKKDFSKQLAANPRAEICAFDGETWLRVAASLIPDPRTEPQESMLEAYPGIAEMYAPGDGNCVVYYLKDAVAKFYSFGGETKEVCF